MSGEDEPELDPGRALYQRLKREREEREREAAAQRAAVPPPPPPDARTVLAPSATSFRAGPSAAQGGQLPPGTLLNQIYEIRRYIASGGMGEVYEGVNLSTDERVAIKIIQKHLADDPQVNAIFRKEARIHTRLIHPALAQYRMATREPTLGVFYIATEFVDGVGLDKLIGEMIPSEAQLRAFMRRLASGLGAAHELGAIHRDISPDNILVPQRNLELAKIIDFGIARDAQASLATIVGNTFAGKLNYVAPEQFGDYGRDIGPWTDIYSLGLVMFAFATGRPVNMGQSLVEAVDRRRAGVNLAGLSLTLRPIFARMLAADPAQRFRSMAELITALGEEDGWVDPAQQFAESWRKEGEAAPAAETTGLMPAPPLTEPTARPIEVTVLGAAFDSAPAPPALSAPLTPTAVDAAAPQTVAREPDVVPPAVQPEALASPAVEVIAPQVETPEAQAAEEDWTEPPEAQAAPADSWTFAPAADPDPPPPEGSLDDALAAEPVVSLFAEPPAPQPEPELALVAPPEAPPPQTLDEPHPELNFESLPAPPVAAEARAPVQAPELPEAAPGAQEAPADALAASVAEPSPEPEPVAEVAARGEPEPVAPVAEAVAEGPLETVAEAVAASDAEPAAAWDEPLAPVAEAVAEAPPDAAAEVTPVPVPEPAAALDEPLAEPVADLASAPAPESPAPEAASDEEPPVVGDDGLTEEERIYAAARLNPPPDAFPPEPPRERWSPFAIQSPVDAASLMTHDVAAPDADDEAAYIAAPDDNLPPWSPIELQKPMTALEFASGQPIEPLDDPPPTFAGAEAEAYEAGDDDDAGPKPVLYALKGLFLRGRRKT